MQSLTSKAPGPVRSETDVQNTNLFAKVTGNTIMKPGIRR